MRVADRLLEPTVAPKKPCHAFDPLRRLATATAAGRRAFPYVVRDALAPCVPEALAFLGEEATGLAHIVQVLGLRVCVQLTTHCLGLRPRRGAQVTHSLLAAALLCTALD